MLTDKAGVLMRTASILLFMAAAVYAFGVEADFLGTRDSGSESLEALGVRVFIDCELKNLTVKVEGRDSGEPVAGADAYLFYTDYGYQPIKRAATDADGYARIDVPGTINHLTALFILRVDKGGYQSREAEFRYWGCFQEPPPTAQPPEEAPKEPPAEEETHVEPPVAEPLAGEEAPIAGPPEDETVPAPVPGVCPLGLALLSLLSIKARR